MKHASDEIGWVESNDTDTRTEGVSADDLASAIGGGHITHTDDDVLGIYSG